jgi:superfamily II DNA or RNA helicase
MIYKGLLDFIVKFAKNGNYELQIDESLNNKTGITYEEVSNFVDSLKLQARGEDLSVREYQYEAIHKGLGEYRSLMLSPTSSGKSLIIYCIIRHLIEHDDEMNILLIVPNTLLVEQFFSDMKDYSTANGWDVEANAQLLYSGKEKLFSKRIMITTWQSLTSMMKNQPDYFNDIVRRTKAAIFDEAHSYKANVVLSTMEKFIHTKHRIGTTGTLDDSKINELSLRGLMGPTYKVISTKELMDAGQISKLKIKCLVLQYPEHLRKELKGIDYQNEINFIVANEKRNKIIRDLALSCKGNTLILFN